MQSVTILAAGAFGALRAPENFLTLKKVESYYITIAQAEILRGGHKLGSEGGS